MPDNRKLMLAKAEQLRRQRRSASPAAPATSPDGIPRNDPSSFARGLGLGTRDVIEGATGAVGVFTDPLTYTINKGLDVAGADGIPRLQRISEMGPEIATNLGLPQPETTGEKVGSFARQMMLPSMGAAAPGAAKAVKQAFVKSADYPTVRPSPTTQQLKEAGSELYESAKGKGVEIPGEDFAWFMNKLGKKLGDEGIDEVLHPKASRALAINIKGAEGGADLNKLMIMRRHLGEAAKSESPDERRLADMAIERLDDFVNKASEEVGGRACHGEQVMGNDAQIRADRGNAGTGFDQKKQGSGHS